MNKIIKELMKHAGTDTSGKWMDIDHAEKFAELIVAECIWALWTEECRTSDLASEEYTRGSNKIKQHFGVEE
jgi:predicted nucleic acid-binding protein